MNGASASNRERLLATAKTLRWPAIWVLAYAALRFAFDRASEDGGLITPGGQVSFAVAALGALVLVLRVAVVFVLPGVVAYRVLRAALASASGPPKAPETWQ